MENHMPPSGDDELRYWETPEYREKYSDSDREQGAKDGWAMPDGSYPIKDQEDLEKAISAVGRGGADHDAIRKHIIARADALDLPKLIPDNWGADGSLKQDNAERTSGGRRKGAQRKGERERARAVPLGREFRFFAPTGLEIRSATDTDEIIVTGAPIVYGAAYRVADFFGEFAETIHPGSVSDLLTRGVDCRLLLNHEGLAMARTTSGTMRMWDTTTMLRFEARLDARQQIANDFAIAVQRGDMTQMSVGMIVARDKWGWDDVEDVETRDIFELRDLLDVSGVTYPCSGTTHLEVAQRVAFSMPLESRARLRRMEVELRAGKVLSADSQSKLVSALSALHDLAASGGIDPHGLTEDDDDPAPPYNHEDGSDGDTSNIESDADVVYPDGTGARTAPETATERREQSLSFGDQQSAVYNALLVKVDDGDGDCDLWICDLGPDWVVYQSYVSPEGLFRLFYALGDDGNVIFAGDPQRVLQETSYVPVPDASAASAAPPAAGTSQARDDAHMTTSTLRLLVEAGRKTD